MQIMSIVAVNQSNLLCMVIVYGEVSREFDVISKP